MDVAYDKLGLQRPASEPVANLGTFTDQPMLDLMTQKAIESLSNGPLFSTAPFILMVEGASIDKQSHPNQAAGTIWDTIEFDKAVGVARAWAAKRPNKDTLIVVTADHDQSMSIIGVSNIADTAYFDRNTSFKTSWKSAQGDQDITVYGDSYANARAGLPFINDQTTASNNGGTRGMPGAFAASSPADKPETSTYSTYYGLTAYKLDTTTGYPVNSGSGLRRMRGSAFAPATTPGQAFRSPRKGRAPISSPATWTKATSSSRWRPPRPPTPLTATSSSTRFS